MHVEASQKAEQFTTVGAAVVFISGVILHVSPKIAGTKETLATLLAKVWLLTCVVGHMSLKARSVNIAFVTVVTTIRPDPFVRQQVVIHLLSGDIHPAERTLTLSDPCHSHLGFFWCLFRAGWRR